MKLYYRQCTLEKFVNGSTLKQVAYIPDCYAILNKVIKIKNEEIWDDGWVVTGVYAKIHEDHLPDNYKAIKLHRKNTGDSVLKCQ